jgi:predicted Zn-dependent peptidase
LYITIDELKELTNNYDIFYDYLNERVAYLGDLTEEQAIATCQEYFGGTPGTELDIGLVDEDTPCGDYWFE